MPHFSVKAQAYAAIEAKYCCTHERRELRVRTVADGRTAYYRQCTRCGQAGKAVSVSIAKSEHRGRVVPAFDNEIEHRWRAKKSAEYVATYNDIEPRLRAEYEAYLASGVWAQRRSVILARASGLCECCEHYPASEVHHKTYERIGHENDADLMAVCGFCHGLLHGLTAP